MKQDNDKAFIIFLMAIILSFANLLFYSFTYIFYGNESVGWIIWSISNYFVFCFGLYAIEKLTLDLKRKKKYLFRFIMILCLVSGLVTGFIISTFSGLTLVPIMLTVLYCLLMIAIIVCGVYCYKKVDWRQAVELKDNAPKRDIKSDYYLFYTKRLENSGGKEGVKIGFSLICLLIVYICFLIAIIFANVVCKEVSVVHIVTACILSAIALAVNQIQIVLTSNRIWIGTIIENGLLTVALSCYFIVEWIFLQVTFNFLLCLACLILIIPLHIKFSQLSKAFNKRYK